MEHTVNVVFVDVNRKKIIESKNSLKIFLLCSNIFCPFSVWHCSVWLLYGHLHDTVLSCGLYICIESVRKKLRIGSITHETLKEDPLF